MLRFSRIATFAAILATTGIAGAQSPDADSTVALLRDLIRANTSNPPGNERRIADVLAPRFKALGFDVQIIQTPDSGKAHFIARLKGDGSKRPDSSRRARGRRRRRAREVEPSIRSPAR